jgi:hypothetical protein
LPGAGGPSHINGEHQDLMSLPSDIAANELLLVLKIHWSHTHDFEIIRGLEALLNSLTFLAPRVGPGMFCWAFRKVEISSTIIPLVKWSGTGKTNFDFANRDKS